jgi:hypothetical protein
MVRKDTTAFVKWKKMMLFVHALKNADIVLTKQTKVTCLHTS